MQSKVNRVVFATVAALLGFAAPAQAATSHAPSAAAPAHGAPASGPYTWKNTTIVAGGFVDGLVFSQARPGLAYARTDIGGAYRWDPAGKRWVPLLDFTGFNDWNELGVESIAADPVDPAKVWVATGEYTQPWALPPDGEVLRSGDQGRTWQAATLPTFGTQGGHRGDRGRPTRTIFVASATDSGTNLYESTDAGATWQAVPGEPTGMMPQHGVIAGRHTLYVDYANEPGPNGMTDGSVWKYDTRTGVWSDITPEVPGAAGNPTFGYAGLAADPRHPGTVMVATNDRWFPIDTIFRSTDGGRTWEDVGADAKLDISASPYLAWGATPKFGWWIASVAIDPFDSSHVIYGTGATVFGSRDVTAADRGLPTHWTSAAAEGIEETAVNDLVAPAAGPCRLVSAVGDLGGFCHTSLNSSPATGMISPILGTGTSVAEAGQAPLDLALVGWSGGDYSADGGATWTAMNLPAGEPFGAGAVALSADGATMVWTAEDQSFAPEPAAPVYSADHGQTWTAVSGLPAGVMAVADPVNPKTFYAFDPSTGTSYTSADGGATFTAAAAGLPIGTGAEQTNSLPQLHTVPGRAGDLWLTGGDGLLYHSADGGATFAKVSSVAAVATLGFGKAAPGAGYPAIYLTGVVAGVQGVFRSTDEGNAWTRINDDAEQWAWIGQTIIGDPNIFGRVYLGTNGRGILYGDPKPAVG